MPSARLALTGDVMLGRLVNDTMAARGPAWPWGDVLPLLKAADLRIMNLECVITTHGKPWTRYPKVFHFRADPIAYVALGIADVDCVTLANNHVLDFEEDGLLDMLDGLAARGIVYTGAGRNFDDASRPALLDVNGMRVAVLAFTDNERPWLAGASRPGTNWLDIPLEQEGFRRVEESIARARDAGADIVIVTNHWGPNMVQRPPAHFRDFAHAVVDAGADLYFGHSAHIFQGVERYEGAFIVYDAGDFVDDYAVDPTLRNDQGLLFYVDVEDGAVRGLEVVPTLIGDCQVNEAPAEDRGRIIRRLIERSAEMDTRAESDGRRIYFRSHVETLGEDRFKHGALPEQPSVPPQP